MGIYKLMSGFGENTGSFSKQTRTKDIFNHMKGTETPGPSGYFGRRQVQTGRMAQGSL